MKNGDVALHIEKCIDYLTTLLDVDGVEQELLDNVGKVSRRTIAIVHKYGRRKDDPDEGRLISALLINEIFVFGKEIGLKLAVDSLRDAIKKCKLDPPQTKGRRTNAMKELMDYVMTGTVDDPNDGDSNVKDNKRDSGTTKP